MSFHYIQWNLWPFVIANDNKQPMQLDNHHGMFLQSNAYFTQIRLSQQTEMIEENVAQPDMDAEAEPSPTKICVKISLRYLLGFSLFTIIIVTVRYTDELYSLKKLNKTDESNKTLISQPIPTSTVTSALPRFVVWSDGNGRGRENTSSPSTTTTTSTNVIENLQFGENKGKVGMLAVGGSESLEVIRTDGRDEQGRCRQENGKLCASNTNSSIAFSENNTSTESTAFQTPTATKVLDNSKNRRKRWLGIRMLLA